MLHTHSGLMQRRDRSLAEPIRSWLFGGTVRKKMIQSRDIPLRNAKKDHFFWIFEPLYLPEKSGCLYKFPSFLVNFSDIVDILWIASHTPGMNIGLCCRKDVNLFSLWHFNMAALTLTINTQSRPNLQFSEHIKSYGLNKIINYQAHMNL